MEVVKDVIFTSPYRKLKIGLGGRIIQFMPILNQGIFKTNDPDLIAELKAHPFFNKEFTLSNKMPRQDDAGNIIQGARTSSNEVKMGVSELDKVRAETKQNLVSLFRRYNEIKPLVVRLDGVPKKDADPELLAEFKHLEEELGLLTIASDETVIETETSSENLEIKE